MKYIYTLLLLLIYINAFSAKATANISTNQKQITAASQTNIIFTQTFSKLWFSMIDNLKANKQKNAHTDMKKLLLLSSFSNDKNAPASELWTIYFSLHKYKAILEHIKRCNTFVFNYDVIFHSQYLSTMLLDYINLEAIRTKIKQLKLVKQDKACLNLVLDFLIIFKYRSSIKIDNIKGKVRKFLAVYPNSPYAAFIKKLPSFVKSLISKKTFIHIGLIYGLLTRNLNDMFRRLIGGSCSISLQNQRFITIIDLSFPVFLPKDDSDEDESYTYLNSSFSLGYLLIDNKLFRLFPSIGGILGGLNTEIGEKGEPGYINNWDFSLSIKLGIHLDFKIGKKSSTDDFTIRVSAEYIPAAFSVFQPKKTGSNVYIGIRFGGWFSFH